MEPVLLSQHIEGNNFASGPLHFGQDLDQRRIFAQWKSSADAILRNDLKPIAEIKISQDVATTRPTSTTGEYPFEIIEVRDVSLGSVARLHYDVEIATFPIEQDRLIRTLNKVKDRAQAHATSINVKYDRREPNPGAFGVWNWAPDGEWGKASEGSKTDHGNYRWSVTSAPSKIDATIAAAPPSDLSFEVSGRFWDETASDSEDDRKASIAEQLGITTNEVTERLTEVISWTMAHSVD